MSSEQEHPGVEPSSQPLSEQKKRKHQKYVWLAALIVLLEAGTLGIRTNRVYSHASANYALTDAINRGDVAGVDAALNAGANPNEKLKSRESYLQVAGDQLLRRNAVEITLFNSMALSKALAMKASSSNPATTLVKQRLAIVTLLLERGANPNPGPGFDFSPLYLSVYTEDSNLVAVLLDHGANPNTDIVPNANGMSTPVILAAASRTECKNPAIIELLLNRGAAIDRANSEGQTSLMIAAQLGDVRMVTLLKNRHARADLKDRTGRTAADFVKQNALPAVERQRLLSALSN